MTHTKEKLMSLKIQRAIDEAKFEKEHGFALKLAESAPELLEALKDLWEHVKLNNEAAQNNDFQINSIFWNAREAIKKATS